MRTRLKRLTLWNRCLITLAILFGGVALVYGSPPDREPKLPPPIEIRDYQPQPNRLMLVEYANGRRFLFRITSIKPRPECNHVQFDSNLRTINIITQAVANAYEYKLEQIPIMVNEWAVWND